MGLLNRMLGTRPASPVRTSSVRPGQVQKPAPKPEGLFGDKNKYSSFKDLKWRVRKEPDRSIPGFGGKLYRPEREKAMERLEGYAKKYLRRTFGLHNKDLGSIKDRSSIIGKMSEEISEAKRRGRWGDAKQLQKDIKIYEQWRKG